MVFSREKSLVTIKKLEKYLMTINKAREVSSGYDEMITLCSELYSGENRATI